MAKKAPRRTAERILEVTLGLFNRFGEPNVSTTLISNELGISPGNLYYHYPAKDELVNALFTRYKADLLELLVSAPEIKHWEDAWFFIHHLMERVWTHRFIYRDLNDLLSRNRRLESEMKDVLQHKDTAFQVMLARLNHAGLINMSEADRQITARHLVLQSTWWLSYAYVRQPRHALEDDNGPAAMVEAAQSMLALCKPYVPGDEKRDLDRLLSCYPVKP
ncbi:MAG: TetR/AcrR family transcriptional regulator [Alphaproteobacteria bacterium]|nr:TetR/AcrR family transcriptional regulator [Alphaproteobacteria bacterium]